MTDSSDLDRIDRALLALLQQDARRSNKELAARVGLAESITLARVRRLMEAGAITGFHADVSPWARGMELQAMVAVRLVRHARDIIERFRDHCRALPQVDRVYHVAGSDDFLLHVGVRDADALREFILTHVSTQRDVVHVETHLIFEVVRGGEAAADGGSARPAGVRASGDARSRGRRRAS